MAATNVGGARTDGLRLRLVLSSICCISLVSLFRLLLVFVNASAAFTLSFIRLIFENPPVFAVFLLTPLVAYGTIHEMKWAGWCDQHPPALVPNLCVRNGPMSILLHATHRRNLPSIGALGVSPAFSQGPRAECWFFSRSRRAWAVAHVAERHDWLPSDIVLVRVSVPRDLLTHRGRGLWTCPRVVRNILSVSLPCAA